MSRFQVLHFEMDCGRIDSKAGRGASSPFRIYPKRMGFSGKDTYEGMRTRKIKNTSTSRAGIDGGGSLLADAVSCPYGDASPLPRLRADAGVVGTAAWPTETSTAVASHGIQSADSGMAAVAQ
mgnify:CR=1 FL=1